MVPLVNVTALNGPTEFITGSHVNIHEHGWWEADEQLSHPKTPILALPASEGSVVLFDIRLRHRGSANRSPKSRAILYLGYVHRWFRDTVNFKEPHTRAWDQLSDVPRALFSRLDTAAYTRELEERYVGCAGSGGRSTPAEVLGPLRSQRAYELVDLNI